MSRRLRCLNAQVPGAKQASLCVTRASRKVFLKLRNAGDPAWSWQPASQPAHVVKLGAYPEL